jgi:hypothetical protein
MDIWLAVIIGITQLVLGGMGVYVSLRPPKPEHHWYWFGGFVAVGIVGIGLTGWLANIGSKEQKRNAVIQERMGQDIKETKEQLQGSRIDLARMSGHLEGIQTVVNNLSKSGWPGMRELALALEKVAANNERGETTDKELCAMAGETSQRLRDLSRTIRAEDSAQGDQFRAMQIQAERDEAKRTEIFNKERETLERERVQRTQDFQLHYVGELMFIKDRFMVRLKDPPPMRGMASALLIDTNNVSPWALDAMADWLSTASHQLCELKK